MRLINKSLTESIYSSLKEELTKESVTVNVGTTTVTSNEAGVTVEDNGNTISATGNANVTITGSDFPVENDINNPVEGPVDDIPVFDETETEIEEPIDDEVGEEDLEESTVNEEVLEKKDEETEEELNNSKVNPTIKLSDTYKEIDVKPENITAGPSIAREINNKKQDKIIDEADGYNQNQNVDIFKNPEFDYDILDITELDNIDDGDVRAIDMNTILNGLDESLTESYGDANYFDINSFQTRKGVHKKTNESYSSAIIELRLPKLNESINEYHNVYFLEVYGNTKLKECVLRDSKNHIIKEYSGKSSNPVEFFKNVFIDIDRSRQLKEEISDEAYYIAECIAKKHNGEELILWKDFQEDVNNWAKDLGYNIDDDDLFEFEQDVRTCMGQLGWSTIYEGTYEGGLTTNDPNDYINEAVEVMVNKPQRPENLNFADSNAITKDKERQENHLKQNEKIYKNKKFRADKGPDQENTRGETVEEITDTTKVEKLPKVKKTKVDAKKTKSLTEATDDEAGKMLSIQRWMEYNDFEDHWEEGAGWSEPNFEYMKKQNYDDFVAEKRNWVSYKDKSALGEFDEMVKRLNESKSLTESAEGIEEFWEKFDNGEIKVGDNFDGVLLLDANKDKDYILVNRGKGFQPFVAAWAPELDGNNLVWGQGHYFDNEEDAREYFNDKLNESTKLKEADEILDNPEVTDGTDIRDGSDELEESGTEVAIFHRKPASVDAMRAAEQNGITVNKSNYKVVGTKELSSDEFNNFINHLSSGSFEWLKDYNDTSNTGEFKCVEVINKDDNSYSLLVDPQGYDYARYVAIKDNMNDEELLEPEEEVLEEPVDVEETEEELIK